MIRARLNRFICFCVVSCTAITTAAPNLAKKQDFFDYLATARPLADWIMHARNEYGAYERFQPIYHPRFHARVGNNVTDQQESTDFEIQHCWSAREILGSNAALAVVPNPCDILRVAGSNHSRLPDRCGLRRIWTDGTLSESEIE